VSEFARFEMLTPAKATGLTNHIWEARDPVDWMENCPQMG
jgi:hypothetical protein